MIEESLSTISLNLNTNFYNKYTSNNNVEIDDSDYYVKVADNVAGVSNIIINNKTYTSDQIINLSIGLNSFIKKPIFKEIDGGLYVSSVGLMVMSDESGDVVITINYEDGGTSNISVNVGSVYTNKLTIGAVSTGGGKKGYENTASKEEIDGVTVVTHNRQDGTAYVKCELFNGDTQLLTSDNHVVYLLKSIDGDTRLSMTELDYDSYALYNYYANYAFADEDGKRPNSRTTNINLRIPDVGAIDFKIVVNETIKA